MEPFFSHGGKLRRHGAAHRVHHAGDSIRRDLRKILRDPAAQFGVDDAVLPDEPREITGVHPVQSGDPALFQKMIQIGLRPEIGRCGTPLAHDVGPGAGRALVIFGDDPVVSDQREGLHDDLAGVAGVGQCFDVSAHSGGEDQLADGIRHVAEADPFKDLPVLQDQITFFHNGLPSVRCTCKKRKRHPTEDVGLPSSAFALVQKIRLLIWNVNAAAHKKSTQKKHCFLQIHD